MAPPLLCDWCRYGTENRHGEGAQPHSCNGKRPCNICTKRTQGGPYYLHFDTDNLLILRYPVRQEEIDNCNDAPKECCACRVLRAGGAKPSSKCNDRVPNTPCLLCIRNKHIITYCTREEPGLSTKITTQFWSIKVGEDGVECPVLDTAF